MNVLGIMSGTSLDGLDMAIASFDKTDNKWRWQMLAASTHPYPGQWKKKLENAPWLGGLDLQFLHQEFGAYMAELVMEFLRENPVPISLIATHGHTVFHQPEAGLTLQIGDPQILASKTGIICIGNFRQLDILYGGQGAPLVPMGDEMLFNDYDFCLNLGGFANVSWSAGGKRLARDICPANIVLNRFSRELNLAFDKDGLAGKAGRLCKPLLESLDGIGYYDGRGPGSLSREWLEEDFLPRILSFDLPVTDILHTLYEHISGQISAMVRRRSRILVTGGGSHNIYLRERITHHSQAEIIVPDKELVDFKEALIFGYLGLLRYRNEINCLSSVTGADKDTSTGVMYYP